MNMKKTKSIRLDASTVCQLNCPSCPTAEGKTKERIGSGFLKFEDFKKIVDENSRISHVELSNWGEIFLNKDILKIIEYAYEKNVALTAMNGVNLNTVSEKVLEALVKYKFRFMSCSLDGASQETYSLYRRNGNFDQVIENIRIINKFKKKYNSKYPELRWQYVAFGHNENEIAKAKEFAEAMGLEFSLKLSWDDLYGESFSPVENKQLVRKEHYAGVSSREEYKEKYGKDYIAKGCCAELWREPQINFNGKLLGCSINQWDDFGDVFEQGLERCLDSEKISYARCMLMGEKQERSDIPCIHCRFYKNMKNSEDWLTEEEVKSDCIAGRNLVMLENKFEHNKFLVKMIRMIIGIERVFKEERNPFLIIKRIFNKGIRFFGHMLRSRGLRLKRLVNDVFSLDVPLPNTEKSFKSYPFFRGKTKTLKSISAHVSCLKPGHRPHPPHIHEEEELLFMLNGEADLIFRDGRITGEDDMRENLKTGQFVYYPSRFAHTLEPTSEQPVNYLMFRWKDKEKHKETSLNFQKYELFGFKEDSPKKGFSSKLVFEGPTGALSKLHCHLSYLKPGSGYPAHDDDYDVAILVLEGEVETIGKRAKPFDVIFYPQGQPHGMHNPGEKEAKYIVFEFHGKRNKVSQDIKGLLEKIFDINVWKRKINCLLNKTKKVL